MAVHVDGSLEGIDWEQAKADLAADRCDNGRSAAALRQLVRAVAARRVRARRRSRRRDGASALRRRMQRVPGRRLDGVRVPPPGIASSHDPPLLDAVPGQHVGLQTGRCTGLYASLGFRAAARVLVASSSDLARQRRESRGEPHAVLHGDDARRLHRGPERLARMALHPRPGPRRPAELRRVHRRGRRARDGVGRRTSGSSSTSSPTRIRASGSGRTTSRAGCSRTTS